MEIFFSLTADVNIKSLSKIKSLEARLDGALGKLWPKIKVSDLVVGNPAHDMGVRELGDL